MNSNVYRRLHISNFYFRGTVRATLKNAGAFCGMFNHGTQQKNSDGSLYLDEVVPTEINGDTVKSDGTVVDGGKIYIQNLILAPDSVMANDSTTQAVVSNFEDQTEIGTVAGTIPKLYIWDGANKDHQSRLGSEDVTASELGSQSFYEGLGFNANYWNYMGLSDTGLTDAAIVPQEKGTFQLNVGDLANGTYDADVSTNNYVQDSSLVLWLDALNNTGSGFDPDAAYWTNLATLGQEDGDAESYQLKNFTKGSWKSNGLHFSGTNQYIDTIRFR